MSAVSRCLTRRSLVGVLAALLLTGGLAACGSSETSADAPPSAAPAGSSGSSPDNQQDAASVKLSQCLREQGVDIPDSQGHSAFSQLSPADRQQLEAALKGPCREFQSGAFGDASDPQSQTFLDALTRFTTCMRKNGVDIPDPVANDPGGPFAVLHSLDQSDPKVAAAASTCQDKLPATGPGG